VSLVRLVRDVSGPVSLVLMGRTVTSVDHAVTARLAGKVFSVINRASRQVPPVASIRAQVPSFGLFTRESSYCFQRVLAIAFLSIRLSVCHTGG